LINSRVEIYTDGACSRNPGRGGWAALLIYGDMARYISGYNKHTTNNRMELNAAIEALRALKRPSHVILFTDSTYLRDGIQRWVHSWEKRGWRNSENKPVLNQDLWKDLLIEARMHHIEWKWVRGHDTNKYNNFVDELARIAISHRAGSDVRLPLLELEGIAR